MKQCKTCQEAKPLDAYARTGWKDTRRGSCKSCHSAAEKARDKSHRVTITPEYKRNKRLVWKYGVSSEQYDEMVQKQGGTCAICRESRSWNRREGDLLVVDHDHATGEVRGLLCHACNQSLGLMRDNITCLRNAIAYLTKEKS